MIPNDPTRQTLSHDVPERIVQIRSPMCFLLPHGSKSLPVALSKSFIGVAVLVRPHLRPECLQLMRPSQACRVLRG
jgi:hypothetical protein